MRALLQFIVRNPWIYVVLAFVVLIGAWITIYVLASGLNQREIPVERPNYRRAPQTTNP